MFFILSDFFETRIGGNEGKSLAKLTRVLTERVASGSSHLLEVEANEVAAYLLITQGKISWDEYSKAG